MSSTPELKTVTVYVRQPESGDEHQRVLTFKRVPELPAKAAIEAGLIVDGAWLVLSVEPVEDNWRNDKPAYDSTLKGTTEQPTLISALGDAEAELVKLLGNLGYEVDFQ